MSRVRDTYKRLRRKYLDKKTYFKQRLAYWQQKGMLVKYQHCVDLMQSADDHIEQINSMLPMQLNPRDKVTMRSKVKSFKALLKELVETTKPVWRQWAEAILVAGTLAFFLRTYVFGLYGVPTGSAEVNLLVGDRICGNKFHYLFSTVKRGDLVIFDKPGFIYDKSNPITYFWQKYVSFPLPLPGLDSVPESWVKRVIALPGDTIEGKVENGKTVVYLNNEKLDEPYVNTLPLIRIRKSVGLIPFDSVGPLRVPSFLRQQEHMRVYTYDPNASYDKQPYYAMSEQTVVKHPVTGQKMLEHPYTPTYNQIGQTYDKFGPFIVPEGKYWVMGDSRKNSQDSRYWGFLDDDRIHGRASFIIYSIDGEESLWLFELLKNPIDFWTKQIRWSRFFSWIK